jgi:putative ABC transport system permease protein
LEWYAAKKLFDMQGVHALMVSARPGEVAHLAGVLKDFCDERSLLLQSNVEVRETLDRQMSGMLGLIWILLSLVFVVASLGIVNTLTMNVLEQTRELGVLRAIGMRRLQVGKLIVAQAVALAMISLAPGVLAGIGLAYLINLSTLPLTGQPVPFHLDIGQVAGCFGTALAITILAALLPARRAVRLQVIQALQYE